MTITIKPDFVHVCTIDFEKSLIMSYLKVYSDLSFTSSFVHSIKGCKISDTNLLSNLLDKLKIDKNNHLSIKFKLQALLDTICPSENNLKTLIFDQIQNLDLEPNGRRYSQAGMLVYLKIFLYSPKIYRYLSKNTLVLPSERHLRRYIYDLPTDVSSFSENKRYLTYKFSQLKPREKLFVLMIDEIHVRPRVDIHLDYGSYGLDHSNPDNTAKTVFGFMVKSIFGKYQEIISLIPSFRGSSKSLFDLTKDILNLADE